MNRWLWIVVLGMSVATWAQNSGNGQSAPPSGAGVPSDAQSPAPSQESTQKTQDATPASKPQPDLSPPRSDRINIADLPDNPGESSSKDTQIDLSPPQDDSKVHPQSSEILRDAESAPGGGDINEFHPWDPHKAIKDIEVGDFYFKQKNYRAAESRYREALYYKENDAIATYRLAVCLEKLDRLDEAEQEYQSYLKILPHGPEAEHATRAIAKLKSPGTKP